MTSNEDQPPKESQRGFFSFMKGNKNKQNNQELISSSKNQNNNPNENATNKHASSMLNLGDSLKSVTLVLHDSISKSSRSQDPPNKPEKETLNLGDSLKDVTAVINEGISKSSRTEDPPNEPEKKTLNLGDSLKDVTAVINEAISKSSRTENPPNEPEKTTLNLGDSLKDVTSVIHEAISTASHDKEQNLDQKKVALNLGNPLESATKALHDSIINHSSSNEDENQSNSVTPNKKEIQNNIFQDIRNSIDNNLQQKSADESGADNSKAKEGDGDHKEEDQKGKLEQYIEDNILITMVNSPHQKLTAETQTDANLYIDDENDGKEEEEEQKEEIEENDLPPIVVTKYSDEELYEALQKQLTTHQLPPYEMREPLIDYARKQSIFRLMEEDYDKASKIDEAVAANLQSLRDDHHNIEADMLNSHLKNRLSEAERSKSSLQDEWKRKIRSFKENEQNELQKINERHEQERRLFESHWSQAAILMPFSKPSSSLLQLRSMQKAFALSHDFVNARQLKITAEKKQKEESIEASKKAAKSMRKEYVTLLKRQQNEILCFNENCSRKLGKMEQQRDFELKVNENVRSQLASRVNKSRAIKKPMVLAPFSTKTEKVSPSLTAVSGQMSYRTRSQFANYRQAVDMKMLDVKIDNLHSIMKPLTPAIQSNSKNQKKGKGSKKT